MLTNPITLMRNATNNLIVFALPVTDDRGEYLPTDLGDDDYQFVAAFRDGSRITRALSRGELQYVARIDETDEYRRITCRMTPAESAAYPEHVETPYAVECVTSDGERHVVAAGVIRAISHPTVDAEV